MLEYKKASKILILNYKIDGWLYCVFFESEYIEPFSTEYIGTVIVFEN